MGREEEEEGAGGQYVLSYNFGQHQVAGGPAHLLSVILLLINSFTVVCPACHHLVIILILFSPNKDIEFLDPTGARRRGAGVTRPESNDQASVERSNGSFLD